MKYFRQSKSYTCGPASLRMILDSFGTIFPEQKLSKMLKSDSKHGTEHHMFALVSKKFGISCVMKTKRRISCFSSMPKSVRVIVCFSHPKEGGHYAVVKNVTKRDIVLLDPYFGPKYRVPLKKFSKWWVDSAGVRGVLFEFRP
jgi:ABC-type bacteriocin/lantibiotic exporter with double-glycine peptidase domain